VLDAAAGLTRYEAEGAYSLSLVREGRLAPSVVWSIKSQQLKKTSLVSLHAGSERFDDLGGLESLKAFCLRALRPKSSAICRPRGVLLLSPPGCGKSALGKALGNEAGRPTLRLDIGALMGSLVGETERNVRRALAIAEAMAPCVLFIDEIDKGLSGVAQSGPADSGVSARLFGTLLTWLSDQTSDVFVVATANDVSRLPPEFTRAERFDGVFFIELPTRAQKDGIWRIHCGRFGITDEQARPDDELWTGAEISACCRLATLLDVPLTAAAQHVVPVAVSSAESLGRLRSWANGRCLAADRAGIYQCDPKSRRRRGIRLDPSDN
jgi:SpoVK/Ycf46/Vps4 family AAA+-type ATPase